MNTLSHELDQRLTQYGQRHLLAGWEQFSPEEKKRFADELNALNFDELQQLYQLRDQPLAALPDRKEIEPLPVEAWNDISLASRQIGEEALRSGKVAALVVAGGLGSRLGFEKPKGMFPIGPVSQSSLFQIHAEKVWKLRQLYGGAVPFLVMTSPATHDETVAFFEANQNFGLDDVHFFQQGSMPALDLKTGQVLLEAPGKLFLGPNGHGGTLTALADSGLLARLKARGVEQIFYFQVDNPLVKIGDPAFVGRHIEKQSDVSSKVVFKTEPAERVGVLASVNGRCSIIEYSDIPREMAEERLADGTLAFRAGNPAIHCFSIAFLERITRGKDRLTYHYARKKVPYFDPQTQSAVTPTVENALKFELFIFDALPLAKTWLAVSVERDDEFAPLKNATGADSPEEVRKAITRNSRKLVAQSGIDFVPPENFEVGPKFALHADEIRHKQEQNQINLLQAYWTS
ncbi:MAG: UDPGP type 1 family protein [Gemmataceae bacterium]